MSLKLRVFAVSKGGSTLRSGAFSHGDSNVCVVPKVEDKETNIYVSSQDAALTQVGFILECHLSGLPLWNQGRRYQLDQSLRCFPEELCGWGLQPETWFSLNPLSNVLNCRMCVDRPIKNKYYSYYRGKQLTKNFHMMMARPDHKSCISKKGLLCSQLT